MTKNDKEIHQSVIKDRMRSGVTWKADGVYIQRCDFSGIDNKTVRYPKLIDIDRDIRYIEMLIAQ